MIAINKTQQTAERVKAIAIAFIGAIFFALGPGYFSEQSSYRVPKILWPVYELFGHVSLAIGLLLLGAIMLFWAYRKFTKYGGKPVVMLVLIPVFVAGGFGLAKLSENTGKQKSGGSELAQAQREKVANEISDADRPELDNEKANQYFDKLEKILAEMTKAKAANDTAAFNSLDKEYTDLHVLMSELIPVLSKTDQYRDFVLYNAKVSKQIDKLRGIE